MKSRNVILARRAVAAALAATALSASTASAYVYDWTLSGNSNTGEIGQSGVEYSGAGAFVTTTPWSAPVLKPDGDWIGGATITAVTGEINGAAILSLSTYGGADNELYSTSPFASDAGVALTTSLDTYSIADPAMHGFAALFLKSVDPSGDNYSARITFNVTEAANLVQTAVPEPAAWTMMLLGFLALGATLRTRHRENQTLGISVSG